MQIHRDSDYKNEIYSLLCDLNGEQVLQLLTDYHGMQLLDDGFVDHLDSEGIIELVEDEDEDEDEDEEATNEN